MEKKRGQLKLTNKNVTNKGDSCIVLSLSIIASVSDSNDSMLTIKYLGKKEEEEEEAGGRLR